MRAAWILLCSGVVWASPTYTKLASPWCDETQHVIYDGKGHFAVQSPPETSVELTLHLEALQSYVNSNDYQSGGALLTWDADFADYGVADNADTARPTGERTAFLSGMNHQGAWNTAQGIKLDTLRAYADSEGKMVLRVSNSMQHGLSVSAVDAQGQTHLLYTAPSLKYSRNTATMGYHVNLNYVTGVRLLTPSTLNTDAYEAPQDYTQPFAGAASAQVPSMRRVMFMGDSITHGVNDQTWRWQLFKIWVDNGIEAEIVGPRSGYTPGYTRLTTPDAGESYGGKPFPNVHLAQSSGRTHNIISGSNAGMSGVNYGGHSTKSAADTYNCNTWICLIGTNDLLSDAGYTPNDFAAKMQRMLGGRVTVRNGDFYWSPGRDWGNLGQIAQHVLREKDDVLYLMTVPCWGKHANNNAPDRHLAVQAYAPLLKKWAKAYARQQGRNVRVVDINQGLVDPSLAVPFSWPDSMSNRPGQDGLHPNAQGSLIIAGNVARAMGLAGRTAGLPRAAASASDWGSSPGGKWVPGKEAGVLAPGAFSATGGFSAECLMRFGDGKKAGWKSPESALSLTLGDGEHGGTLRLCEGGIYWGDTALYGADTSALSEPLRVVWHPGNQAHNVARGFYVWLGDMLIGQGLAPTPGERLNGVRLSAVGGQVKCGTMYWTDKAMAPPTQGKAAAEGVYIVPAEP